MGEHDLNVVRPDDGDDDDAVGDAKRISFSVVRGRNDDAMRAFDGIRRRGVPSENRRAYYSARDELLTGGGLILQMPDFSAIGRIFAM